jgi:uncharacterized membrane protein
VSIPTLSKVEQGDRLEFFVIEGKAVLAVLAVLLEVKIAALLAARFNDILEATKLVSSSSRLFCTVAMASLMAGRFLPVAFPSWGE